MSKRLICYYIVKNNDIPSGRTRWRQSLKRKKKEAFKHGRISCKVRGQIFLRTLRKPLPDFYGSHNKFLFSLPPLARVFLFFSHSRKLSTYFASFSSLFLSLSLFLFLSIVVCNLDKYPLCRWCKCTRRDRKKNESSRRRVAVRKSREITVELLIPVLFNVSIICRRK